AAVIARQPSRAQPTDAAVQHAWKDLASTDAKVAYRALVLLLDAPAQAVHLLQSQLKPAAALDAKRIERLLAELDSEDFADRQRAAKELEQLGDAAEPALRKFLQSVPSAEARRRAETLVNRAAGPLTDPDALRAVRAAEVLEGIGDSEAVKLL